MIERTSARSVLEAGCGSGELALSLAKQGMRVTAFDPEPEMIRAARDAAGEFSTPPEFMEAGLGDLSRLERGFDLAVCVGNTLPHLSNREQVKRFFQDCAGLLAPRGMLVVQTVNFDRVVAMGDAQMPVLESEVSPGKLVKLERRYDLSQAPERVIFHTCLTTSEKARDYSFPLLCLSSDELLEMAETSGFGSSQLLGSYREDPWSVESPATILVSERRQPD